jgi:hypothetical protein
VAAFFAPRFMKKCDINQNYSKDRILFFVISPPRSFLSPLIT